MKTRLIVVAHADRVVGLIVDSAREFVTIPADAIQPPPEAMAGRAATTWPASRRSTRKVILILDVAEVHPDQRRQPRPGRLRTCDRMPPRINHDSHPETDMATDTDADIDRLRAGERTRSRPRR